MSWLARSLVNSLKVDDDEEQEDNNRINSRNRESSKDDDEEDEEEEDQQVQIDSSEIPNRGVKEDLSDFTKTLSRQLWGVASFLAPPPPPPPSSILVRDSSEPLQNSPTSSSHQISSTDPSVSNSNLWESSDQSFSGEVFDGDVPDSARLAGIRSDFAEIGGKFRTGISKLSNNKAVSEISKIASTFLPFGSEEESDENYSVGHAIGVTDEVLAFARNIAMHPETWLDFPLADEEDLDDFDLSDAQHEHALAVERLAPRLAALRIELCPVHMSEGCFWKIYFVLLHSRLNKHDAELLSTPQIVEARAIWMQELHCQTKPNSDWSGRGISHPKEAVKSLRDDYNPSPFNALPETISSKAFSFESTTPIVSKDIETEKYPISNSELQIIDKSVIEERPFIQSKNKDTLTYSTSKILDQKYEDDGDDWLKEDQEEIGGFSGTTISIGNEDDVSFSDLEEDDYESISTSSKTAVRDSNSSTKEV